MHKALLQRENGGKDRAQPKGGRGSQCCADSLWITESLRNHRILEAGESPRLPKCTCQGLSRAVTLPHGKRELPPSCCPPFTSQRTFPTKEEFPGWFSPLPFPHPPCCYCLGSELPRERAANINLMELPCVEKDRGQSPAPGFLPSQPGPEQIFHGMPTSQGFQA